MIIATYTWNTYSGLPTVEHWDIIPEFQTQVSEYGSGKLVRNNKWPTERWKFRIRYRRPIRASDITPIKDFFIARKGRFESFLLYVPPLGTTHTVMFTTDASNFDYFATTLAEFAQVEFLEEVT